MRQPRPHVSVQETLSKLVVDSAYSWLLERLLRIDGPAKGNFDDFIHRLGNILEDKQDHVVPNVPENYTEQTSPHSTMILQSQGRNKIRR